MGSKFAGIEIAKSSLIAQNVAIDVAAHNISNASTLGYSRQTVLLRSTARLNASGAIASTAPKNMGQGVDIASIGRIRDAFVDYQVRWETGELGNWQTRRDQLEQIERIFGEPSENGIRDAIVRFSNALDELSKRPENLSVRATVVEEGKALGQLITHIYRRLDEQQGDINDQIRTEMLSINSYAQQVADLNVRIVELEASAQSALDLRDRRDLILDKLAHIISIDVQEQKSGAVVVRIGGRNIVEGSSITEIECQDNAFAVELVWTGSEAPVEAGAGKIAGLIHIRDISLTSYMDQLNTLANGIITWFNDIHSIGYGLDGSTGVDFFVGSGAADMAVSDEITTDPYFNKIAAGSDPDEEGDGDNAARLSTLADAQVIGKASPVGFFISLISSLAVESDASNRMSQNQDYIVSEVLLKRESISGVSIDEELADLIRYQHAYSAAARVVSTLDEMLDTLINRMAW